MLVFGGAKDFNMGRILLYLKNNNIPHLPIILSEDYVPSIIWDIEKDDLFIDGKRINSKAIYMRQDVFNSTGSGPDCGNSCYATLRSWALAHPEVKMFNKSYIGMHKAYNIHLAKQFGLEIPKTLLANKMDAFRPIPQKNNLVVKPVAGGQYTKTLEQFFDDLPNHEVDKRHPVVFLQERLEQPEMRIFCIGGTCYGFNLVSDMLDYREDKKTKVVQAEPPKDLAKKLSKLCEFLGLEYAAADFKSCAQTGKYLFLEVNSSPMFAAFDKESNGEICKAITTFLNA